MMYLSTVIYYRTEAKTVDSRTFLCYDSVIDWFKRQNELEPTYILGIYEHGENERYARDMESFRKKFKQDSES